MTTAAQIVAAIPAAAYCEGYYGSRFVSIDWEHRAELLADVVAMLPAGDDVTGWSDLAATLSDELYAAGGDNRLTAEALEAAIGTAINANAGLIVLSAAAYPVASRLRGWLSSRAMGQVSSAIIPAYAAAQVSIYHTA